MVGHGAFRVITASRPEWIGSFTKLEPIRFRKLGRLVAKRGGNAPVDGSEGTPDRFVVGVSHSAAHRVVDSIGPLPAPAPVRELRVAAVVIVDGALVPCPGSRDDCTVHHDSGIAGMRAGRLG